jgi:hypothetical protein
MQLKEDTAQKVVLSCCILHNFLIEHQPKSYLRVTSKDHMETDPVKAKKWIDNATVTKLKTQRGNYDMYDGKAVRAYLTEYYMHIDRLTWQEEYGTFKITLGHNYSS